jgi:hypothetical protein
MPSFKLTETAVGGTTRACLHNANPFTSSLDFALQRLASRVDLDDGRLEFIRVGLLHRELLRVVAL